MHLVIASRSRGPVGNDASFQARVVAKDATGSTVTDEGKAVRQADCSSITCTVYDLNSSTPGTAVATPSITIAGAISDTLTDDAIWLPNDSVGRNFLHTVAGSIITAAGHTYRVVYTLTLTGGTVIKWGHEHAAVGLAPA